MVSKGGYPQFIAEGWNDNYLPVWLQDEGYNTYMVGKFMNGYSNDTYNDPLPNGWTSRDCNAVFPPVGSIS